MIEASCSPMKEKGKITAEWLRTGAAFMENRMYNNYISEVPLFVFPSFCLSGPYGGWGPTGAGFSALFALTSAL